MSWNWQLPDWPSFHYDPQAIRDMERQFLLRVGSEFAFLKNIGKEDYSQFVVEILSAEGADSSKIEGEILDRESLQSSIRKQFGFDHAKSGKSKEKEIAALLHNVYETYEQPLTHQMLGKWHEMVMVDRPDIAEQGRYRSHSEPMQIVSNRYGSPQVFFEAPPSERIPQEMGRYLDWFNQESVFGSILARAAIGHLYFENIHPFEDGNGRIGRILIEKVLFQGVGCPLLIAVSRILEKRKKAYYSQLQKCNRSLDASDWVVFFSEIVLEAQQEAMDLLYFLIEKTKILQNLCGQINFRQEKALLRMFAEGPQGFVGGMSAEKYISITKTSRATATRDLNDLVQKGALSKIGEYRHTRYHLNLLRNAESD